jgi:WD40 repeat protein
VCQPGESCGVIFCAEDGKRRQRRCLLFRDPEASLGPLPLLPPPVISFFLLFSTDLLYICSSGNPIPSGSSDMAYDSSEAIDPKCNTVCYMKSEGNATATTSPLRNTIATNAKYICYAVKGNLMRVINATTGDKLLLRGHSHPISDMKFSSSDENILCSLEDQEGGGNIFIWKLFKEEEFVSTTLCQLPFNASFVHGHPLAATLWAVAHRSSLCLFSTLHPPQTNSRLALNDFAVHQSFLGDVVGGSLLPSLI